MPPKLYRHESEQAIFRYTLALMVGFAQFVICLGIVQLV